MDEIWQFGGDGSVIWIEGWSDNRFNEANKFKKVQIYSY